MGFYPNAITCIHLPGSIFLVWACGHRIKSSHTGYSVKSDKNVPQWTSMGHECESHLHPTLMHFSLNKPPIQCVTDQIGKSN